MTAPSTIDVGRLDIMLGELRLPSMKAIWADFAARADKEGWPAARFTRNGYDLRSLVDQFDAKPGEVRRLLRGELDAARAVELLDQMRAAGLPT